MMNLRALPLLALLLLPILTACAAGGSTTSAGEAAADGCRQSVLIDAPGKRYPPDEEPSSPYPGSIIAQARPYGEVFASIPDPDLTGFEGEEYLREELFEKHVKSWEGWVVETGVAAVDRARNHSDVHSGPSQAVLLQMSDPYTSTTSWWEDRPGHVFVLLYLDKGEEGPCIGQKVRFEGDVRVAPVKRGTSPIVTVSAARVDVLEDRLSLAGPARGSNTGILRYEATAGFTPTTHSITLSGDGTVVVLFAGLYGPFRAHIVRLSPETAKEITQNFDAVAARHALEATPPPRGPGYHISKPGTDRTFYFSTGCILPDLPDYVKDFEQSLYALVEEAAVP